jgi:hypothetical protein
VAIQGSRESYNVVIAGLDPAIHSIRPGAGLDRTGMDARYPSPGMTTVE